jgi:hypothetical protein
MLSEEQSIIIESIKNGRNVVSDCVAGSGKTTTVLHIAQACPQLKCCLVTYNCSLKLETRVKAESMNLKNLEIHSYNSLAVKYYHRGAYVQENLLSVIQQDYKPLTPIPSYDVLIADETQDMSDVFFKLLKKFVRNAVIPPKQMLVLGDKWQTIYKFGGADERFLTMTSIVWERPFVPCTLTMSFRVTHQIAAMANNVMLGINRIRACKEGPAVDYRICDPFNLEGTVGKELVDDIYSGLIKPSDVFILAYSLKSTDVATPIRKFENFLVHNNIPCFFQLTDDARMDEELLKDKVVFSTFHKSKGRERKRVIIFGFDNTYFKFFSKEEPQNECPPLLYVAVTRASQHLTLLQSWKESPLPFLRQSLDDMKTLDYIKFIPDRPYLGPDGDTGATAHNRKETVTRLTERLQAHHQYQLDTMMADMYVCEKAAYNDTAIVNKITGKTVEDVSLINGIAIPAMIEMEMLNKCTIAIYVAQEYENTCKRNDNPWMRSKYKSIHEGINSIQGFAKCAMFFIAFTEKIINHINQIAKFNWLTTAAVNECKTVLRHYCNETSKFEQTIQMLSDLCPEYGIIEINGRLDICDTIQVIEVKCVQAITLEHKLQLIVYAYMCKNNDGYKHMKEFRLINIRTGECFRLNLHSHLIEETIRILFHNKYEQKEVLTNEEFITQSRSDKCKNMGVRIVPQSIPLFVRDNDEDYGV